MTDTSISVVVPSVTGWSDLEGCLRALYQQTGVEGVEVIVPERLGGDMPRQIATAFPEALVLTVDSETTIPEMRARAFEAATAPAVAVLEDHVLVPTDWAARLLAELENSDGAVAGSVENGATSTLMDRAAFLCEYSHCMPPIPAGEVDWLTGNNVVYKKELLDAHRDIWMQGKWENVLHDAFKESGKKLICRPEIEVIHKLHYGPFDYLGQRYLYARSYAGARVQGESAVKRFVYGCAAFVLPPILLLRIFKRVYDKERDRGTLFCSLPLLILFVIFWAWGEVVGYWFGAGNSLSRVR